ncbi:hypothetical protein C8Q73DRAFT_68663 [Cubamyces lactineus]|nr:hypothetical protein C8Q73DRAFT_68663 [Cubamyces lactineus]
MLPPLRLYRVILCAQLQCLRLSFWPCYHVDAVLTFAVVRAHPDARQVLPAARRKLSVASRKINH